MKKLLATILFIVSSMLCLGSVPMKVTIDGTFSGISNGNHDVTVTILGTPFKETITTPVVDGVMSIDLGNKTPLAINYFNQNVSTFNISIPSVGSVSLPIRSVPFAIVSADTERIRGKEISTTAPVPGQVLKYNGTMWAPAADAGLSSGITSNYTGNLTVNGTITATTLVGNGAGVTGVLQAQNASKIGGYSVNMAGIANGKILKYNGTSFVIGDDNIGAAPGAHFVTNNYSGAVTISGLMTAQKFKGDGSELIVGTANIASKLVANSLTNAEVKAGAAIDFSKLNITKANIDGLNIAAATASSANYATNAANSSKIGGYSVNMAGIANGKILKYNGTSFVIGDDNIGAAPGAHFVTNNYSGSVTISGLVTAQKFKGDGSELIVGTANIASKLVGNSLTNAEVSPTAAIVFSKLNITKANIDGLNVAAATATTANIASKLVGNSLTNSEVSPTAAIAFSKLNITKANIDGLNVAAATATTANYATTAANASKLGGYTVNMAGISNGQILKYNGTSFVASADNIGSAPGAQFVTNNYSGAVTISGLMTAQKFKGDGSELVVGTANIASKLVGNSLTNAEVSPTAAIAFSKLNITKANIDGLNVAAATATTANIASKLVGNSLTNAEVSPTAAIAFSKLNITKSNIDGLNVAAATATTANYATTAANASKLGGYTVNMAGISNGQILKYNGTSFVASADNIGSAPGAQFVTNNYSGAVTISGLMTAQKFKGDGSELVVGTANIASKLVGNSLTNAEVSPTAAIAFSKLNITKSNIDGLNVAAATATTANIASKLVGNSLTNAEVSPTAAIAFSKLNITKSNIDGLNVAAATASTANYATTAASATNATKIGNITVNTAGIVSGQYLKYNGTSFVSSNVSISGMVTNNYTGAVTISGLMTAQKFKGDGSELIVGTANIASKLVGNSLTNAEVSPTAAIAFSKLNITKSNIDGLNVAAATASTANYSTTAATATNAIKIGGVTVNTSGIVSGQYLKYDGTSFVSSNVSIAGMVTNNYNGAVTLNSILSVAGMLKANGSILVNGSSSASGNIQADNIVVSGKVTTNALAITGGSDLAELFDIDSPTIVEPGTVVVIDPSTVGGLKVSSTAYDKKVVGVVSGANGINPGLIMTQTGSLADGQYPVAMTGRAWVKCDTSNQSIEPGDMLTTSSLAGHAMKAIDTDLSRGAVIGKAMSGLEKGKQGMVLVIFISF